MPISPITLTACVILLLGVIALWGILESVAIAAVLTVVEIGGLLFVIFYGLWIKPEVLTEIGRLVPPWELGAWSGIASAGLLAFFAFVGFEDIANVAEEVENPGRNLPRAILYTLVVATLLYLAVVSVVVLVVPMGQLISSSAPLTLVFENSGGATRGVFTVIAIFATINGVLIQMIMASRVLYGLASQGHLYRKLAYIHPATHTPVVTTVLVVLLILFCAVLLPIAELAEATSFIVLSVFMLVNLALIRMKLVADTSNEDVFRVPVWPPNLAVRKQGLLQILQEQQRQSVSFAAPSGLAKNHR